MHLKQDRLEMRRSSSKLLDPVRNSQVGSTRSRNKSSLTDIEVIPNAYNTANFKMKRSGSEMQLSKKPNGRKRYLEPISEFLTIQPEAKAKHDPKEDGLTF